MHALGSFLSHPALLRHFAAGMNQVGGHAPHALKAVAGPAGYAAGKVVQGAFRLFF